MTTQTAEQRVQAALENSLTDIVESLKREVKESETIKKRIAVFEYTSFGSCSSMAGYQTICDESRENDSDLIRVSEWTDVEFTPIPKELVMPEIIAGIDRQIEGIKDKAMDEVARLQTKRAEILAISHDA